VGEITLFPFSHWNMKILGKSLHENAFALAITAGIEQGVNAADDSLGA
jgi:hypothetical protein